MYELKTKVNDANVVEFLNSVENEKRRTDAMIMLDLMTKVTGLQPRMWGPSIIGFGTYHYRYESGHEGDAPLAGFSPRKSSLVLYINQDFEHCEALMSKLGKFKTGKVCLYITRLDQIDISVLREVVLKSFERVRSLYPET